MTRRRTYGEHPQADQYARAVVAAADELGERHLLRAMDSGAQLRATPLRARALAYQALHYRFPEAHPRALMRTLGLVVTRARHDSRIVYRVASAI